MMKKVFTVFAVAASLIATAQPFEGSITYKNSIKSKTPQMTDAQWLQMLGGKQEYYIKGGNYKSVTDGTYAQWQLYNNAENKVYSKMSASETVLWNDASVNQDQVIKSEVKKNAATILGYPCDELTLTCKSGVQKYYYSSKLPVDAKMFEKHKYGNWHDFVSRSGALSLKTVIETPQFSMETVATDVKPMKLEDKFFALPAGTKTAKNPNG
jgi:hypothetical protein